ncbi:MAG: PDZ domain-containing protein [Chloroflexi bacterium]|nr:PDZ domain-containing protein [Chloroflexota bacterium]
MKTKLLCGIILLSVVLIRPDLSAASPTSTDATARRFPAATDQACTSFCLNNGDHCVFGANQDNLIAAGLLFVNKRHVLKTAWDPSTSGEYARWISKYGSVTFVHAGYQLAWAGMNEAGLMISTMALGVTENPAPDERPPLSSSFWVQYQLDNHSTVDEVLASESEVRIADTVDHYLVCDRTGDCATIEFLEGELVYHRGETLPAKALTNSTYQELVSVWREGRVRSGVTVHSLDYDGPLARAGIQVGDLIVAVDGIQLSVDQSLEEFFYQLLSTHEPGEEVEFTINPQAAQSTVTVAVELGARITEEGEEVASLGMLGLSSNTSLVRFAAAADRLQAFEPASSEEAVSYAFATLDAVAQAATAWSVVLDPANLRVYFRTSENPLIRFVDLGVLDFSCHTPVMMLDVHADVSGDISDSLVVYSREVSLDHTLNFVEQYELLDLPPLLADALLGGLESFPCVAGEADAVEEAGLLLKDGMPLLPPRVKWVGLTVLRRLWPVWIPLTLLSLAFVIYRLARRPGLSWGRRLAWVLVVTAIGPFGLLVYLLAHRKRRMEKAA